MSAPALRALLGGLLDYAGLFPPAALSMAEAVAAYGAHRSSAEAWALGRFVLPAGRLDEFAAAMPSAVGPGPWRLSVLGQATDTDIIGAFNARHAGRAVVESVETTVQSLDALRALGALAPLAAFGPVFVEIPVRDDPDAFVRTLGERGLRAKIRTGGVVRDAFPPAEAVARFLASCARHDVAFKATAGLHHPLRGEYALTYDAGADRGPMFGFLNVLLAALFVRVGMPATDAVPLLEERDPAAIRFDATGVRWRTYGAGADAVAAVRAQFALGVGSCSFREPMDELPALHLT